MKTQVKYLGAFGALVEITAADGRVIISQHYGRAEDAPLVAMRFNNALAVHNAALDKERFLELQSEITRRDEAIASLQERVKELGAHSSFVFDDFGTSRIVSGSPDAVHGLQIKFARLRVVEQQAVSERNRADKATEKYTRVRESVKKIAEGGF